MLGDIGEGLEGDREDRDDQRRRLQEENCIDTSQGFVSRDFLYHVVHLHVHKLTLIASLTASCWVM